MNIYEMSEDKQEIDEIIEHLWGFLRPLFICLQQHIIPPKSSRFVDMLESRIHRRRGTSK